MRDAALDDDSGGGTDSLIRYTPSSTGIYWLVVTTFCANETGGCRLSVD
ncbi:MAG TPA: hypothetical protein VIK93_08135 [Limnochordales bacterium]